MLFKTHYWMGKQKQAWFTEAWIELITKCASCRLYAVSPSPKYIMKTSILEFTHMVTVSDLTSPNLVKILISSHFSLCGPKYFCSSSVRGLGSGCKSSCTWLSPCQWVASQRLFARYIGSLRFLATHAVSDLSFNLVLVLLKLLSQLSSFFMSAYSLYHQPSPVPTQQSALRLFTNQLNTLACFAMQLCTRTICLSQGMGWRGEFDGGSWNSKANSKKEVGVLRAHQLM